MCLCLNSLCALHQNRTRGTCLPRCHTLLQANTEANRKMKLAAPQNTFPKDNCRVLRPGCRGFYSLVNSNCLKSSVKTVALQMRQLSPSPCSAVQPCGQEDSEQLEQISRAIEPQKSGCRFITFRTQLRT